LITNIRARAQGVNMNIDIRSLSRARQQGVAMVEFAIVMPFALLLVLAIIQLGLMFSAKAIVNEGAFLAARAGSVQNAQSDPMLAALQKALIPLYQNTTTKDDASRLYTALQAAKNDNNCNGQSCFKIDVLNPTPAAFSDFGVTSSASSGHTYIPNDNLELRSHSDVGATSGLSIQDANALQIKVTYGYQIKVPLMQSVIKSVMCSISSGLDAFGAGNPSVSNGSGDDCTTYYSQGRIPLVAYATVQMQTPAYASDN